jgi:hypothetical protein
MVSVTPRGTWRLTCRRREDAVDTRTNGHGDPAQLRSILSRGLFAAAHPAPLRFIVLPPPPATDGRGHAAAPPRFVHPSAEEGPWQRS